jgi:cyclic di-GMP phosphodiesterase Gmr
MIVEAAQLLLAPDGTGTTVVFCDLDGFKAVNDRHGHDAGDALLAAVGARLRSAVRPGDVVGRWGGDEFVLLRPGIADAAAQERLRQRVRAAIAAVSTPDGDPAAGSVGTAVGLPGDDLDDALAAADAAMYVAKRGRRAAC